MKNLDVTEVIEAIGLEWPIPWTWEVSEDAGTSADYEG